jgi:hypothetical protein
MPNPIGTMRRNVGDISFFAYITAYTNDKILIFLKFVDKSSMNKSLLQNKYFSKTLIIIIIHNAVESTISCSFFISSM